MKMNKKLLLLTVCLLLLSLVFSACGDKEITGIEITEGLEREYSIGDTPDLSGVKAHITYNDGTREEAHPDPEKHDYGGGKDYWGSMHIKQIQQFYRACLGLEELDISGERTLPMHKLICDIYDAGGMRK